MGSTHQGSLLDSPKVRYFECDSPGIDHAALTMPLCSEVEALSFSASFRQHSDLLSRLNPNFRHLRETSAASRLIP